MDSSTIAVRQAFAETMQELALAHVHRLHRSWWAAAGAIEAVRWKRGSGEARLLGGVVAPVSCSCAAELKRAGWR